MTSAPAYDAPALRAAVAHSTPGWPADLTEHMARALVMARSSSIDNAKIVVAPLSIEEAVGPVAGSAFANLANRRGLVRKVVILGPARRSALRGIAIPTGDSLTTPMGNVAFDAAGLARLAHLSAVTPDERAFAEDNPILPLLPLLQACLGEFALTPLVVGSVYPALIAEALRHIWGGQETLIVIASDLSQHLPDDRARAFDIETRAIIETLAHDQLTTERADGHRIIAGALMRAEALDLRVTGLDLRTSGVTSTRVRGHGAFAFEPAQTARLSSPERRYLLRMAAQSIMAAVKNPVSPARPMTASRLPMPLSAIRATTVTLTRGHVLRGSAGGLRPFRTVLSDVIARAGEAVVADPRFAPLLPDELRDLQISISITSHPRSLPTESDDAILAALTPGRDGLVIEHRGRLTVAMPAEWERLPDPVVFLRALKQRAGLAGDAAPTALSIRRFTAETFAAPFATLFD